jgi:hypothetical protein
MIGECLPEDDPIDHGHQQGWAPNEISLFVD